MKPATTFYCLTAACAVLLGSLSSQAADTSDLAYSEQIHSDKRMKCLYGYFAEKTGDHESAVAILQDCIDRWNDVYSMLLLAQIHDLGVYLPANPQKSTALMRRGALLQDEAGYASLARYHYGKALYTGYGTEVDKPAGIKYLRLAANEGVTEACQFLASVGEACSH
ncbi:hypothetical protein L2750_17450 [Shewanella submarina]|uniref:Sel1 repeat family protein n=1 Tax=Shewanella submarina TaxID=2016376 RepID=A0ABV7GE34_9GAMM|nr:hypothetical protein [Shewanella submarina]MCL1038918.1 hypothetical protein [Shewanella submarina]